MERADCQRVRALLPLYQEDGLAATDAVDVRAHLTGCEPCRGERAAQGQLDALLGAAYSDHPFGDAAVESILSGLPLRGATATSPRSISARLARRAAARPQGMGVAIAAALLLSLGLSLFAGWSPEGAVPARPGPQAAGPQEAGPQQAGPLARAGEGLLLLTPDGSSLSLERGMPVQAGDELVAIASPAELTLADGTRISVHADTVVSLRADQDGGVTCVLGESDGAVFCDVAKRRQPFRVEARGMQVEVLGTRFVVHQDPRSSRVAVVEGAVRVRGRASAAGAQVRLGPDDAAEVHLLQGTLSTLRVTARTWAAWVPDLRREVVPGQPAPAQPEPEPDPLETPAGGPAGDADMDVPVLPPGER